MNEIQQFEKFCDDSDIEDLESPSPEAYNAAFHVWRVLTASIPCEHKTQQPVESLRHLGNVLVILAELHPDDQCRAYTEALAYHNQKCPDAIVEPIMGVTRLVHTYPGEPVRESIDPEEYKRMQAEWKSMKDWNAKFIQENVALRLQVSEATWHPIETAPKDGTQVLLLIEHENFAYYPEDRWRSRIVGHWITHNEGGWTWQGMYGKPTLWQPLPTMPITQIEGEAS